METTVTQPTTGHWFVERKIGNTIAPNGNALTVWEGEHLGGSRAMPLFMKIYAELMENGHATTHMSWMDGNKINFVYVFDEATQQVAGGIAFEYRQISREGWIILSFTDTAYRGQRINQLASSYFENIIRNRGGYKIASHVHVNNTARLKSAERAGLIPEYYRMSKRIA